MVITEMRVGGASLAALETAKALSREFDFSFACGRSDEPDAVLSEAACAFRLHEVHTLVQPVELLTDARAVRDIRAIICAETPAIVHSHSSKAGIIARIASRPTDAAVVHSIHGWGHTPADSPIRRRLLIVAERAAARWCDALIADSSEVRDEGLQLRIGRASQYTVIPAFVEFAPSQPDWAAARRQARDALGLSHDATVIGWVGRFEAQKDPVVMAEVIRRALQRDASRLAVLIGDGSQRPEVEDRLNAAGLRERVLLTGVRMDLRQLYAAFDVLLHTSRWEGHPRVPQEAIAERVPVVMAATAGTRAILADPRAGLAVEPGDVEGFVSGVEYVLSGDGPRAPLARDIVVAVAAINGREVSVARQRAVYQSLLRR